METDINHIQDQVFLKMVSTVQLATRQPNNFREILTKVKFEEKPVPPPVK